MRYIFEMPPDKIMFLAMILESYEDVAIITTVAPGDKSGASKSGGSYKSVVAANVADNYDELFHRIIRSLNDPDIVPRPFEKE
jgi:hypothetical protein